MFHFGLKVGESDDDLRAVLEQLRNAEVPILRTADQGVVHSLFIEDPDGIQLELYIDVQPALWKEDPSAVGAPTTAPSIVSGSKGDRRDLSPKRPLFTRLQIRMGQVDGIGGQHYHRRSQPCEGGFHVRRKQGLHEAVL
jgi:catechol-2,3-dioxygenase